jgi:hypothetical protein
MPKAFSNNYTRAVMRVLVSFINPHARIVDSAQPTLMKNQFKIIFEREKGSQYHVTVEPCELLFHAKLNLIYT